MKTKLTHLIVFLMLVCGLNQVYGQWTVYTCDVTPDAADPVWVKSDVTEGVTDGAAPVHCTVEDDPDIEGNKVIKIEQLVKEPNVRESWIMPWGTSDPNTGATVVARGKPTPEILAAGSDDTDYRYFFLTTRNGVASDNFSWKYPGVLSSKSIVGVEEISFPGDDWHIFRININNDSINVYVDENPTPVIAGISDKTVDDSYIKIGDQKKNYPCGIYYDWVAWDTTGAYAPGEGTAFPSELTGISTSARDNIEIGSDLSVYPNPFSGNTIIGYEVRTGSMTRIDIFDMTGKLVRNLMNELQLPGKHEVVFNAEGLPAGMYYCRMRTGESVSAIKMTHR